MNRFESPPPELRAEVYRDGTWHTLERGWLVHWTAADPGPVLYAISGHANSRVRAPWRAWRRDTIIASGGLELATADTRERATT